MNFTIDTAAGAGLTGSKVARRIGDVDEFEFKAIGENHNQGVSFLGVCFCFKLMLIGGNRKSLY